MENRRLLSAEPISLAFAIPASYETHPAITASLDPTDAHRDAAQPDYGEHRAVSARQDDGAESSKEPHDGPPDTKHIELVLQIWGSSKDVVEPSPYSTRTDANLRKDTAIDDPTSTTARQQPTEVSREPVTGPGSQDHAQPSAPASEPHDGQPDSKHIELVLQISGNSKDVVEPSPYGARTDANLRKDTAIDDPTSTTARQQPTEVSREPVTGPGSQDHAQPSASASASAPAPASDLNRMHSIDLATAPAPFKGERPQSLPAEPRAGERDEMKTALSMPSLLSQAMTTTHALDPIDANTPFNPSLTISSETTRPAQTPFFGAIQHNAGLSLASPAVRGSEPAGTPNAGQIPMERPLGTINGQPEAVDALGALSQPPLLVGYPTPLSLSGVDGEIRGLVPQLNTTIKAPIGTMVGEALGGIFAGLAFSGHRRRQRTGSHKN